MKRLSFAPVSTLNPISNYCEVYLYYMTFPFIQDVRPLKSIFHTFYRPNEIRTTQENNRASPYTFCRLFTTKTDYMTVFKTNFLVLVIIIWYWLLPY